MPRNKQAAHRLDVPDDIHAMPSSEALPLLAKASGGRVLVSFSGGKDSVACVERLREWFGDVRLIFCEMVPGLRITAETIDYYERRWQCRIPRLLHPAFHWQHDELAYCLPTTARAVEWWEPVPHASFDQQVRRLKWGMGWSDDVPSAIGIKMADSLFRRAALKKSGPYNGFRNVIHPCYDLSNDDVYALLRDRGTRVAVDYHLFYRSFDGIDYRFLAPLREHYPDDYERLKFWFPLLAAQLQRYDYAEARSAEERAAFAL